MPVGEENEAAPEEAPSSCFEDCRTHIQSTHIDASALKTFRVARALRTLGSSLIKNYNGGNDKSRLSPCAMRSLFLLSLPGR